MSPALHPPERPPHSRYKPARACFAAYLTEAARGNEVYGMSRGFTECHGMYVMGLPRMMTRNIISYNTASYYHAIILPYCHIRTSDSVPQIYNMTKTRFSINLAKRSYITTTPPSPHRLYDLQDTLDKRIHFLPQLSDFVPLRNGFYSFREQTDCHYPVDPDSYTVVARGVADLYP